MASRFRAAIDGFDIAAWAEKNGVELWKQVGRSIYATCPVCRSKKKLSISLDKKIARCFKCEAGFGRGVWDGRADCVRFVMIVLGCHRGRAIAEIFENAGPIPIDLPILDQRDLDLPLESLLIGASCNAEHPCRKFLEERGMSRFVGSWFMCPTGRYQGRIIIPVHSFGEAWGFDAKTYVGGEPKSLANLREGAIYLTERWDQGRDFAVLTESVFDAETLGLNAVGLFGSALDEDRLTTLLRLRSFGVTKLIWFLDNDAFAKQLSIIRKWTSLYFTNLRVRAPEGHDPNSIRDLSTCWKLVKEAKPLQSAFDYVDDLMGARA